MSRNIRNSILETLGAMKQDQSISESGNGGSEQLWLDAAFELLVNSGVDAVKVMPMAKMLNLSRTGFYWHFKDRETLLAALLKRWENKNTGNLVTQTESYAETITEAMFNLFDCWIDPDLFDAKLDFAVRNWSRKDPKVKAIVDSADQVRIEAINKMFLKFGFAEDNADVRAHNVYFTQVGYISMMVQEVRDERLSRMPAYVELYTGVGPMPREIARFMARHKQDTVS